MNVTYLAHSGFLLEWEHFYTLFDWWQGELPVLKQNKPLLVFASHSHQDHFDPKIFRLDGAYFFLSHDIRLHTRHWERYGLTEEIFSRVTRLRPDSLVTTEAGGTPLTIRTVKSTDEGVAFLLSSENRLIYHAGDLNLWHWEEEGDAYCAAMAASYRQAMEKLSAAVRDEAADTGCPPFLDAAMVPMDPRLEDAYGLGITELLRHVNVRYVFPMHMWQKYDWIERYCREYPENAGCIVAIHREGESFRI